MKKIGMTALAALAFVSCGKQATITRTDDAPSMPAEATPPPAPAPAERTKPMAQTSPPPAAPAPELAPDGVFYLLSAARVESPEGIHGLPPGTGVKQIRPGIYLTPYGEAPIDPTQLTNDMARARAARDADRAAQSSVQARLSSDAARAAERARAAAEQAAASSAADAREPAPRYIEGTINQSSGLQSSTALGASHTKTDDGVLWQKSPDGRYWVPVKYLRGGGTYRLPPSRPVR